MRTDEYMKTSNPRIFAAGDVVGRMPLVTVAAMEGSIAARTWANSPAAPSESLRFFVRDRDSRRMGG